MGASVGLSGWGGVEDVREGMKPSLPSSHAEFMINLSTQNVIPFLVQHLFLQDWGESKKRRLDSKLDSVGTSQAQKTFCVPRFLCAASRL